MTNYDTLLHRYFLNILLIKYQKTVDNLLIKVDNMSKKPSPGGLYLNI